MSSERDHPEISCRLFQDPVAVAQFHIANSKSKYYWDMTCASHLVLNKLVLLCRHWLVISDSTTLGEDLNPEENLTRLAVASGSENWGQRVRASSERLQPVHGWSDSPSHETSPLDTLSQPQFVGWIGRGPNWLTCLALSALLSEVLFATLDSNLHQFSCCLKMTTIALMLSTLLLVLCEEDLSL